MPKEKIGHSATVENMDGHDCHVEVQWARDEPRVIVFTRTQQAYTLSEFGDREPEGIKLDGKCVPESSGESIDFHGFGCVLDGDGLNDLIATLKRARRMAFGGDATGPFGCSTNGEFTPFAGDDGLRADAIYAVDSAS